MDTMIDPHASDGSADADLADANGGGLVGQVLDGRYELTSELGAGGMGVVYAARHVVLGNRFAVKVLRPPPAREAAEAMERFKREARAASALGHPNIVDIKDFGSLPGGSSYYVMEHLEGHDLLAEVERHGPLPTTRLAHVGAQIAEALAAAHERGIVHRDLKPENVFLTTRGGSPDHVKLIDFGIAKVTSGEIGLAKTMPPLAALAMASSPSGGRFTAAGIVLGTPAYMSPEQCAGRDVDFRSDLYALGVLLYESATGAVPFDADSVFELMRKHQQEVPRDPREKAPHLPEELARLILSLLSKDPAQRPASMDVVARALRSFDPREARPSAEAIEAAIRSSVVAPRGSLPNGTPARLYAEDLSSAPSFAKPISTPPAASASASEPRRPWLVWAAAALAMIGIAGAAAAGSLLASRARTADVPAAIVAPSPSTTVAPAVVSVPVAPPAPRPEAEPAPAAAETPTLAASESPAPAAPARAAGRPRRPVEVRAPEVAPSPAPAPAPAAEPAPAPSTGRPRPTDAVRDPWAD